jgi:hypothetical protein
LSEDSENGVSRRRKNSPRRIEDSARYESLVEPDRKRRKGFIVVLRTAAVILVALCTHLR